MQRGRDLVCKPLVESSSEFALALSAEQFHRLVDQHGPTLYRVAFRLMGNRHDAEDVVQDAFRSVWDSRDRFDAEKGERAWLIAILRRRIVDRWRKKKQPMPLSDHDDNTPELEAPTSQTRPSVMKCKPPWPASPRTYGKPSCWLSSGN